MLNCVQSLKCICVCFAEEKAGSVYGAPARWGDGEALDVAVELKNQTKIRLMRAGAARYLIQNIIFFL